jgi:hypothetical protein
MTYITFYTVIVSNFTNMNKMNKHISPQIIVHKKCPQHMALDIQVLALDRHNIVAGLNQLMRAQPPQDNSPTADIIKQ